MRKHPVRGFGKRAVFTGSFALHARALPLWGYGGGQLGAGVQVLAINGGAATAVREALAQKPGALSRKKVVVWACSARDFFDESITWERVPLSRK